MYRASQRMSRHHHFPDSFQAVSTARQPYPKLLASQVMLPILEFVSKFFLAEKQTNSGKGEHNLKVKTNVKAGKAVWGT